MTFTTSAATLTAGSVTHNSATLTLTGHTGNWWIKRTTPPSTTCTAKTSGITAHSLTSLTPAAAHVYVAYSNALCSAVVASVSFSTNGVALSAGDLVATEAGAAIYTVMLATAPSAAVTVTLSKNAGGDASITFDTDSGRAGDQSTLTFTTADWSTPQTVTVAAAPDADSVHGTAVITHTATSADTAYDNQTSTLKITESDDEVCPGTTAVGGPGVTTGGLVDDCNTLLALKAALQGTSTALDGATDGWATSRAVASWKGVTTANGRVTGIGLASAGLNGAIPNTLGRLTRLNVLDLRSNSLTGPIPAELGNLTGLTEMWLNGNSLTGPVPAELGRLTALTRLNLGGNSLSRTVPAELGRLTALTRLWLHSNNLSGPIPAELRGLTALTVLYLHGNNLSGAVPAELGRLTALTRFYLYGNNLSGCYPPNFAGFSGDDYRINPQQNSVNLKACSGIAVSEAHVSATENTSTTTYQVKLAAAPTSRVIVTVSADTGSDTDITIDTDAGTPGNQNTLTFNVGTPGNQNTPTFNATTWSTPQTVTITAAPDEDNTNGTAVITHTANSLDTAYNTLIATTTATEADDDPALTANGVTHNTATLTLTGHTGNWWIKQTAPTSTTCTAKTSTTTHSLTNLTANRSYTYTAYTNSGCTTTIDSASFTTPHAPALTASRVTHNTATLTLTGHTDNWSLKRTAPTTGTCTTKTGTYTHNLTNLNASTTYTYTAYSDSLCSTTIDSAAFTTPPAALTASDVTPQHSHTHPHRPHRQLVA